MRTQYDGWIDEDLGKLAAKKNWSGTQTRAARRHLMATAKGDAAAAWNLLLHDARVRTELDIAADDATKL
jgi:hypothetical protein